MSEGTFFHSAQPNITLYLPGYTVRFKNGRYPANKSQLCTDPNEIAAIKAHDMYGGVIESDDDRQARLAPDPKVEEDLLEKALNRLSSIPGVVASELTQPQSPEDPVTESQKPEPDQPAPVPSLTAISRMNKKALKKLAAQLNVEVTDRDTVAILRRKVKSEVKKIT